LVISSKKDFLGGTSTAQQFSAYKMNDVQRSAFKEMFQATRGIASLLSDNPNIPGDFKGDIDAFKALMLIGTGKADDSVKLFSYLSYMCRVHLKNGNSSFFKSDEFKKRVRVTLEKMGLLEHIKPDTFVSAFRFVGDSGTSHEAIFTKKEREALWRFIETYIELYPVYTGSATYPVDRVPIKY